MSVTIPFLRGISLTMVRLTVGVTMNCLQRPGAVLELGPGHLCAHITISFENLCFSRSNTLKFDFNGSMDIF